MIVVLEAGDVFLREGFTCLDLDDFHRLISMTGDAVLDPSLHENMISVGKVSGHFIKSDSSYTSDYDPMLVSQFMTLQTEPLSGLDDQPLDLGMRQIIQHRERPPGSLLMIIALGHHSSASNKKPIHRTTKESLAHAPTILTVSHCIAKGAHASNMRTML